jgi:hypothetical protein
VTAVDVNGSLPAEEREAPHDVAPICSGSVELVYATEALLLEAPNGRGLINGHGLLWRLKRDESAYVDPGTEDAGESSACHLVIGAAANSGRHDPVAGPAPQ